MSVHRTTATVLNALAAFVDGFSTPWLFIAVYGLVTPYVWASYSPHEAARIGAVCTGLWIADGFLFLPVVRELLRKWSGAKLAAGFLSPLIRLNAVWGNPALGALDLFFLFERPLAWAVYLDGPGKDKSVSSRIARSAPWFGGAVLACGAVAMAVRWLENDAALYITVSGAGGLVAAIFKAVAGLLASETASAGIPVSSPPESEEPPVTESYWLPPALALTVLAVALLLPKDLVYLSPGFVRDLAVWEPVARTSLATAFVTAVAMRPVWYRYGLMAGAVVVLGACASAVLGLPVAPWLAGTGLGLLVTAAAGWKPSLRPSLAWALGVFLFFRIAGVFWTGFAYSRVLSGTVAAVAFLTLATAWRRASGPSAAPAGAVSGDT